MLIATIFRFVIVAICCAGFTETNQKDQIAFVQGARRAHQTKRRTFSARSEVADAAQPHGMRRNSMFTHSNTTWTINKSLIIFCKLTLSSSNYVTYLQSGQGNIAQSKGRRRVGRASTIQVEGRAEAMMQLIESDRCPGSKSSLTHTKHFVTMKKWKWI